MFALLSLNRILYKARTTIHWWAPVGCVIALVVFLVVEFAMPKKYEAMAILQISASKVEIKSVDKVLNAQEISKSIYNDVKDEQRIKRIARKEGLDRGYVEGSVPYAKMIEKMQNSIDIFVNEENIVRMTYTYTDRKIAENVLSDVIDDVRQHYSRAYVSSVSSAIDFSDSRYKDAEKEFENSSQALSDYRREQAALSPEVLAKKREDLRTREFDLKLLKESISPIENRIMDLESALAQAGELSPTKESSTIQMIRSQRFEKDLELKELLNDFTEKHPSVKAARKQLKIIDEQLNEAIQNDLSPEGESGNRMTALQFNLNREQDSLNQKKQDIAAFEAEIEQKQKELDEADERAPEVARQMRYYEDQIRLAADKQKEAKASLEDTRQARALVDASIGPTTANLGPNLVIQQSPSAPPIPSPTTKKVAVLALGLGGFSAFALLALLLILDQTIRTMVEVRKIVQMPVIGSLPNVRSANRMSETIILEHSSIVLIPLLASIALYSTYFISNSHADKILRVALKLTTIFHGMV